MNYRDRFLREGGVGSGNFGHAGRSGVVGGSAPGVASKVTGAVRAEGGITMSTHGDVPHEGFAVAGIRNGGTKVEQVFSHDITARDVANFIEKNRSVLSDPNAYIGAWVDNGKTYLDVSQVFTDRTAALTAARARDEIAMFDLSKMETVYTMADQKRPSESKAKLAEADASKKVHMIFGRDLTLGQIAATINAARNAEKNNG